MQQKDTFCVTEPGTSLDTHLWVIISDPSEFPDQVFSLNVTTWHDGISDNTCLLYEGEHSWIKWTSYVYYENPKVFIDAELERLAAGRLLTKYEPVSETVFDRILGGIMESKKLSSHWADLLVDQGVISY